MLLNLQQVTKNTFRYLVLGLFLSLFYDLIQFSARSDESSGIESGGVERGVRTFS